MTAPVRFAIIGCGGIGALHAKVLQDLPGAELVAVADTDADRAQLMADRTGARALTVDATFAAADLDAVTICTPSGMHAELGTLAARAGKHVLLEKPIDVRLDAADELLAACAATGVQLSVISQHRFDAAVTHLKQAIDAGLLGRVFLADVVVKWWREQSYYDVADWRGTKAMDGGALLNQGVHYVDLLLWLLGPATCVYARCSTAAHTMEADDLALVTVEFERGALATLQITTAAYPGLTETLSVTGTGGTVVIEGTEVALWAIRDGDDPAAGAPARDVPADDSHRLQVLDFVDAIQSDRPPSVTGLDARAALELVTAAYESERTGLPVALPLSPALP